MPNTLREKCIRSIPSIRVSESLANALEKLSAQEHRDISDYVRIVLTMHVFGHASTLIPRDDRGS